jgi:hypothetical protein
MFGKEPVIIAAALAAVVQGLLIWITNDLTVGVNAESILPFLTILGGFIARPRVASDNTVRKAGITMDKLDRVAEDPTLRLRVHNINDS